MTNLSNNTLAREIGVKAASAWHDAAKYGDGGDALATHALYIAFRTASFVAEVNRGSTKEPEIQEVRFDLGDIDTDPFNNDGSVDMKLKAARTVAVASVVFGLTELDNASKQRLSRAMKMALYLARKYSADDDETYFGRVSTRSVKVSRATGAGMTTCLVVPNEAIYAEPAEDADDEDKARYETLRATPKTLNGKDKASLAELTKRANPPKATRAAGEQKDKGASFVASLAYVRAIVQQNANPNADEADIGLSEAVRRDLFALAQDIAAYFAADPLEDSEEVEHKQAA